MDAPERINDFTGCNIILNNYYNIIFDEYEKGNYYFCLYKCKDFFEISLKLPMSILLYCMEEKISQEDFDINSTNDKQKRGFNNLTKKVFSPLLGKLATLGDWNSAAKYICKEKHLEELPIKKEHFSICKLCQQILCKVTDTFNTEINHKYSNLVHWRNEVIGHGAVDIDQDRVKEHVQVLISLMNKLIDDSRCEKLCFTINSLDAASHFVIKGETETNINPEPYFSYEAVLFDSYNPIRKRAHVLDYENGYKAFSTILADKINNVNRKLKYKAINTNIRDGYLTREDIDELNNSINFEPKPYLWFYDKVKEFVGTYEGGIFTIKAPRGSGKTIFADSIAYNNEFAINVDSQYAKYKYFSDNEKDLYIWTYHINPLWGSRFSTFFEVLSNFFNQDHQGDAELHNYRRYLENAIEDYYSLLEKLEQNTNSSSEEQIQEKKKEIQDLFSNLLETGYDRLTEAQLLNNNGKFLFVIDGVDELRKGKSCLPIELLLSQDNIPDNIYILLLGRIDEEWDGWKELAQNSYPPEILDDETNYQFLSGYITSRFETIPSDAIDKLVSLSDKKILYLRMLCQIIKQNSNPYAFIEEILSQPNNTSVLKLWLTRQEKQNPFKRKYLERILQLLALLPRSVLIEELQFLYDGTEDAVTLELASLLKELESFIKVERNVTPEGHYSLANEGIREEILKRRNQNG